ncbi:MAG TPA: SurA N-terminal domain-containing protein [Terriglobales bacterium]|jgi:hypothetical protein
MVQRLFIAIAILSAMLSALPAHAGEILDRIVASVNRHVILQSDWEDALCFEAFIAARRLDELTATDRKAALDRLIDQELLREQMQASDFQHASDADVGARIREIRNQYPDAQNDEGWQRALSQHGLSERELKERLALELDLLRLVDARLRPTVQIDAKEIESYYNRELLPQLRQTGARETTLAEVTPKIKELLVQQKVNQLLASWLENLRAGSEIHSYFSSGEQSR